MSTRGLAVAPAMAVEANQKKNNRQHHHQHHFVFGYGSLICQESRKVTNPGLAKKAALPVMIQDVERVWSARTISGWTAMGVRFQEGAQCSGVLIEVTPEQLKDLDKREANYNRLPVSLENVDQVPFLDEDEFYEEDHIVFDAKDDENDAVDEDRVKVWIYMQKEDDQMAPDASHPIPQSYVDIIIRGCLSISEDFAKTYIETTEGWENQDEDNHWVDDRQLPIYRRADPEFSSVHGDKIDSLLEEQTKLAEERVQYDPVEHLEYLADALEEDKAHPKAIKHVAQRVKAASNDELPLLDTTVKKELFTKTPNPTTDSK